MKTDAPLSSLFLEGPKSAPIPNLALKTEPTASKNLNPEAVTLPVAVKAAKKDIVPVPAAAPATPKTETLKPAVSASSPAVVAAAAPQKTEAAPAAQKKQPAAHTAVANTNSLNGVNPMMPFGPALSPFYDMFFPQQPQPLIFPTPSQSFLELATELKSNPDVHLRTHAQPNFQQYPVPNVGYMPLTFPNPTAFGFSPSLNEPFVPATQVTGLPHANVLPLQNPFAGTSFERMPFPFNPAGMPFLGTPMANMAMFF